MTREAVSDLIAIAQLLQDKNVCSFPVAAMCEPLAGVQYHTTLILTLANPASSSRGLVPLPPSPHNRCQGLIDGGCAHLLDPRPQKAAPMRTPYTTVNVNLTAL